MSDSRRQDEVPQPDTDQNHVLHVVLSIVWILLMGLVWVNTKPLSVQANAVGDFLAGAFAPLAFYWLIIGYYLQRQELILQRRELALNREQLVAQAEEMRRQANASASMMLLQEKEAQNKILNDKADALPAKVLELIMRYRPFHTIGKRKPNGDYSVTFASNVPQTPEPVSLRRFSEQMLSTTSQWERSHETDNGKMHVCLENRNAEAANLLEIEFRELLDWWEGCRQLSASTGLDALASVGKQCGVEALLKATGLALNINVGRANVVLEGVTVRATGIVGTPN